MIMIIPTPSSPTSKIPPPPPPPQQYSSPSSIIPQQENPYISSILAERKKLLQRFYHLQQHVDLGKTVVEVEKKKKGEVEKEECNGSWLGGDV